ncbi:MAG: PhnD/SsuA/transferrin family substrate-binding protein [Rhodocyclaceae bacterium]|jgi:phosphonate transport system substrate-binding protein|nr:PhnD/SsuA/transferrin family substrate-binding protein [Rhodocyclaceae bacterium]MDP3036507.1 PhnD/SsuA/transferrin family substrate-binding protein [Rhodocyclaceae bacterium]
MGSIELPNGNCGNRRRRALLQAGAAAFALGSAGAFASTVSAQRTIRIGLTPAFVHDQHALMAEWRNYLEAKLGVAVEFHPRNSYRESMDLLHQGRLDFAWLCVYPFLYLKDLVRLLAVPLNQGRPYYRSYLLVAADDQRRNSMADLKGGAFAYSDLYSNTGYLVPRYQVRQLGEDPATFFRKTFFTWSHRKAVEAVAAGMADGAAMDSFVWDTLLQVKPALTGSTRIIGASPEYGFPPFAAHRSVSASDFNAMQRVLFGMQDDATGRQLLERLNLTGFIAGDRRLYDGVVTMMRAFGEY